MKRGTELIKKAVKDFELARKYGDAKEYITASILYRTATEKVLKALYQYRKNKNPPSNATIEYLAEQTMLPSSIYEDIVAMPDERTEIMEEESLMEYDEVESTRRAVASEYHSTLMKHELVRRLLDYAEANV